MDVCCLLVEEVKEAGFAWQKALQEARHVMILPKGRAVAATT
jgi:hypothetical protein